MKLSDLNEKYQRQVRDQLNAHIHLVPIKEDRRIKQDPKPLMNKLESDWMVLLEDYRQRTRPDLPPLRAQAKRYKIANGGWYKPDVSASRWPNPAGRDVETAWELKGNSRFRGADSCILALKTAAHQWPEVRFVLVWREDGNWKQQEVKP